jgi:hypothetical protein
MEPAQIEYRRRIWYLYVVLFFTHHLAKQSLHRSYLYHADRSYALVLGRPNAIQDDYTSTLAPLNSDDEPTSSNIKNSPSLSKPSKMSFVILRHSLASVIGHIVHHFQQVRVPSHYSDVIALDDELLKFINNLPPHFSLDPDTSLDDNSRYIPVHRFLLVTEILFVRISLHRPYLLRRLESDRYSRSRLACFQSAMKDFRVRQAFREAMPEDIQHSLSNAYREFQTAMISGIYLVLNPTGRDADVMHAILDTFMKDHEGVREMDETTRRELKTIEFLKIKASQAEGRSRGANQVDQPMEIVSNGADHPVEAQLLLGLQQSASRPTNDLPSSRPAFPAVQTSHLSPRGSPSTPYQTTASVTPTFQRLQASTNADGYIHSPAGSGSPNAEDESAAQSLLDHWCNNVSNGPPLDGLMGNGMPWAGVGSSDFPAWGGAAAPVIANDPSILTGLDGSDWNYWETLVNQIQLRGGPDF